MKQFSIPASIHNELRAAEADCCDRSNAEPDEIEVADAIYNARRVGDRYILELSVDAADYLADALDGHISRCIGGEPDMRTREGAREWGMIRGLQGLRRRLIRALTVQS